MAGKLPAELKIPHMGWNALEVKQGKLLSGVNGEYVYFVHSFYAEGCGDSLAAVKKVVFDDKKITMAQLIDALDNNFEGAEDILYLLKNGKSMEDLLL